VKKAVIFDLDGTLWDSSGCIYQIWNKVFERHAEIPFRVVLSDIARYMGKTTDEIGAMLFPEQSTEFQRQILLECCVEEDVYLRENGAELYDGLEETLRVLKEKYSLYIVSNCQDGYIDAFLYAHNLGDYFADIEMSGRTGMSKGENIALIIKRNGIDKSMYIGDTEGDEKASRYAGIPFIYAKYGFGKAVAPDAVIGRLSELPDVAAKFLD
jgi:phosphoglycolate phosphatase